MVLGVVVAIVFLFGVLLSLMVVVFGFNLGLAVVLSLVVVCSGGWLWCGGGGCVPVYVERREK